MYVSRYICRKAEGRERSESWLEAAAGAGNEESPGFLLPRLKSDSSLPSRELGQLSCAREKA